MSMAAGCKKVVGHLNDYIDNEIPAKLKSEIDAHLKQCPFCWELIESYRKTINLIKKAHDVEPDKNMMKRIMDKLNAKLSSK
jgi:anti-sigma factor RsiW